MESSTERVVRDLMTVEVATLKRNESLSIANQIMHLGRIRHMPVVDDGEVLVGIVTQRDLIFNALARALGFGTYAKAKTLESLRVKEVMATDVRTTTPDTPLAEAAATMLKYKVGCLPVVDGSNVLVGLLTEADFVSAFTS